MGHVVTSVIHFSLTWFVALSRLKEIMKGFVGPALKLATFLGVLVATGVGGEGVRQNVDSEEDNGGGDEGDGSGGSEGGSGGSGGEFKPPPFNPGPIQSAIGLNGIEYTYAPYSSWSGQTSSSAPYFITYPKNSEQVVRVVGWASTSGRNVRVQGFRLSNPPLTVSPADHPSNTVIIDMTKYLTNMTMSSLSVPGRSGLLPSTLNTVVAGAGTTIESLLSFLESRGFGMVTSPVAGAATVGGILATGGHGTAIPARNERLQGIGFSYGSLNNLVVELKAVVQDPATGRWMERTFSRWDPEISAFLVNLGRAVVTQATFMVGKNFVLRALSRVDVPVTEFFAHPSNGKHAFRTMAKFIDEVGRVNAVWYPFSDYPWMKLWIVRKTKPSEGRVVTSPYNYQFPTSELNPQTPGPIFGPQAFRNAMQGLTTTDTWDIWGWSKNSLLYNNDSSTPVASSGFVVLTTRSNIQMVLYEIALFYTNLVNEFGAQSIYPIDQFMEFGVTGLDNPLETRIPNARVPFLSPLSPLGTPFKQSYDVGVWMNTVTTTRRYWSDEFMRRMEGWAYTRFNGNDGLARPEWSRNWGHSESAPFASPELMTQTIPNVFGVEQWNQAVAILNKYDPRQVISNQFLREFLVPYQQPTEGVKESQTEDEIIVDVGDEEK